MLVYIPCHLQANKKGCIINHLSRFLQIKQITSFCEGKLRKWEGGGVYEGIKVKRYEVRGEKEKKCMIVYNVELSREIIQIIVWKLKIFKMRERGEW